MSAQEAPPNSSVEPIAVSPAEAARLAGIGRTTIYAAISSGELSSLKLCLVCEFPGQGKRRESGPQGRIKCDPQNTIRAAIIAAAP